MRIATDPVGVSSLLDRGTQRAGNRRTQLASARDFTSYGGAAALRLAPRAPRTDHATFEPLRREPSRPTGASSRLIATSRTASASSAAA